MGENTVDRARLRWSRTLASLVAVVVAVIGFGMPAIANADSTLPSIELTEPGTAIDGIQATTNHRPTWTWSAYVPTGAEPADTFVTAQCQVDTGSWIICNPLAVPSASFRPTLVQSLADGDHVLNVRWAQFSVNDPSTATETGPSTTSDIRVDSTAPALSLSVPADDDGQRTPDLPFTIADPGVGANPGTGVDDATVACRVYAVDAQTVPDFTPCASPFRSPALLRNTAYRFEVTGEDKLRNSVTTSGDWVVQNATPVAADDTVTAHSGNDLAITLPATDADGDAMSYTAAEPVDGSSAPTGSLDRTDIADGKVTFHAPADFAGDVIFTYTADDGREDGVGTGTITVHVANAAPATPDVAKNAEAGDDVPVALPATDADGDALTVTTDAPIQVDEAGAPILDGGHPIPVGSLDTSDIANGNVVLHVPNSFSGKVAFGYTANDGRVGGISHGTAVVMVTPQTDITATPITNDNPQHETNQTTPTWTFGSGVAGATFECRLTQTDVDPVHVISDWVACDSGTYTSPAALPEGT